MIVSRIDEASIKHWVLLTVFLVGFVAGFVMTGVLVLTLTAG